MVNSKSRSGILTANYSYLARQVENCKNPFEYLASIFLNCTGRGDRTLTLLSGQGILSEFFFRTISSPYHFWLRVGRSCLLLRRLTSQVVSTPSLVYQCLARPPYYLFMVVILQPNSSNFLHERFHSRRDSTMYIVSPSCLPIPTSRHNLLYFNELIICGPDEIRTHNSLNANQVLYQLELQAQNFNELNFQ